MKNGEKVDSVRVGRYDMAALKRVLSEFGLKRDETYTWEKKKAEIDLKKAFEQPSYTREEL